MSVVDLWVNTLDDVIPEGMLAGQIRAALLGLPPSRQVKLYNAGSFFDPGADELTGFGGAAQHHHPIYFRRLSRPAPAQMRLPAAALLFNQHFDFAADHAAVDA